jgi:hypothetical protein
MNADALCMLPLITCKEAFMTRSIPSIKCFKANTSNFPENFLAFRKNFPASSKDFPAFAKNFLALQKLVSPSANLHGLCPCGAQKQESETRAYAAGKD